MAAPRTPQRGLSAGYGFKCGDTPRHLSPSLTPLTWPRLLLCPWAGRIQEKQESQAQESTSSLGVLQIFTPPYKNRCPRAGEVDRRHRTENAPHSGKDRDRGLLNCRCFLLWHSRRWTLAYIAAKGPQLPVYSTQGGKKKKWRWENVPEVHRGLSAF